MMRLYLAGEGTDISVLALQSSSCANLKTAVDKEKKKCCFYVNHSRVIRDSLVRVREKLDKQQRDMLPTDGSNHRSIAPPG